MREEAARMVGDQAAVDEEAGVVVGETCRASQKNLKYLTEEKSWGQEAAVETGSDKLGMAAQLQRRDERASQLEEQPTLRCSGTGSSKKRKQKQRRRPKGQVMNDR